MSDERSFSPPAPRGLRPGVVSVLVGIAFLLGLGLAVVLVRHQMTRGDPITSPLAQPTSAPLGPLTVPPASDPATTAAREAVMSGQIASLESRIAAITASAAAAGTQASRAEALLTALAARRALDRGMGLGVLDQQLLTRFGAAQPRAVQIVRAAARQPVTLEDLRQGLDAIGPAAATGVSRGWLESLHHELANLVVLHRTGTPSPLPEDHLARARRLLQAEQVDAARAEVAQMPGAGDAANWLTAARRYALARQALDVLEATALTAAPPAPAPR